MHATSLRLAGALIAALACGPLARAEEAAPPPAPAGSADAAQVEARKQLQLGVVLLEEGRYAEAAKVLGKALDADEGSYVAHLRYQDAVIRAGDAKSLPAEYDEIVKDRPDDPAAPLHRLRLEPAAARVPKLAALARERAGDATVQLELGRAHLALGDAATARRHLDAAWKADPSLADVLGLSCEAMRRSGDVAGARTRLEDALKKAPDLYDAHLRLARLDVAEGKFEAALTRIDKVLAVRGSHVGAMLLRSEAFSRAGKLEDARTALDAVLRLRKDDPDALIASADLAGRVGTPESLKQAVETYRKVLTIPGASQLRAFYGLGWAQERLGLLKEAGDAYREASLLAPGDAQVVNSVGVVLLKLRRFADALIQFQKATDLDRNSPEAFLNIAAVADEQGDWKKAIEWYTKVLSMKGQDKNLRALLNCAFDHEELTQFKRAEDLLNKAREIRPDDSEIATFVGDNLMFQKKWKAAVKPYQAGVKLDEKNRFAWRGLGLALAQDGKPQDAVEALEKAKALKADDLVTLLVLGDLYLSEVENLEKALENYKGYVKAGGNNPDVPVIITNIETELAERKGGEK